MTSSTRKSSLERNRYTQMIADWLDENNISLAGLNVEEIEEKVKGCFSFNVS